ncbi:ADP-ribosylglycohydrolase family protein [uncultured Desulfobacter sp.]|uniref:ADP-ribosylglycohydrolase family protein n=1 Tax=uncultured Desulfobacter sp. TaxID=240139 RepID=UPI00374A8570
MILPGPQEYPPLILSLYNHPDQLIEAVRAQTQMTHKDTNTVDAAVFFSLLVVECLKGTPPSETMKRLSQGRFSDSPISMWTQQGLDAADQESVPAIIRFGQSCSILDAFPGIVQVITRHENDLSGAVIQSVMAGGDNAARAAIVAMVLAAYRGLDDKTREWAEGLNQKEVISACLERIV